MSFKTLTLRDLRNFDEEPRALILDAMEAGCTGRISSKGHAILRNAGGGTMSVSRDMSLANRSAQNTRAAYKTFAEQHAEAYVAPFDAKPSPLLRETRIGRDAITVAYNLDEAAVNTFKAAHPDLDLFTEVAVHLSDDGVTLAAINKQEKNMATAVKSSKQARRSAKHITPRRTQPDPELPGLVPLEEGWEAYYGGHHALDATPYAFQVLPDGSTRYFCRWPECNVLLFSKESLGGHQRGHTVERRRAEKDRVLADRALREQAAAMTVDLDKVERAVEASAPVEITDRVHEAIGIVDSIRAMLGTDPRITVLEAEIVRLTEERDTAVKAAEEMGAKMALLREALNL